MGFTAVFGCVFVDVKGFSLVRYNPTGRNIGDVKIVHGGVCRNVSENLANIGAPVSFVTMFEPNALGDEVRRHLAARGVSLKYAGEYPAGMGMWMAIMDENGELAGSISRQPDFSGMEAQIDRLGDEIVRNCDGIVLEVDMNGAIARKVFDLAEKYEKDVYVIVSNLGVLSKHPEFLKKVRLFILNEIEAGTMFGCKLENVPRSEVLKAAIEGADRLGIREIVVTIGSQGAVYYDAIAKQSGEIPAEKVHMVDSTGAGDAFFSGTVAARMRGASLRRAAEMGTHLAALTIQSEASTCPRVEGYMNNYTEAYKNE